MIIITTMTMSTTEPELVVVVGAIGVVVLVVTFGVVVVFIVFVGVGVVGANTFARRNIIIFHYKNVSILARFLDIADRIILSNALALLIYCLDCLIIIFSISNSF